MYKNVFREFLLFIIRVKFFLRLNKKKSLNETEKIELFRYFKAN